MIEYKNISRIVGRRNLWFTNVSREEAGKLGKYGRVFSEPVSKLGLDMKKVCILDPEAKKTLIPRDRKRFRYFVFGGILGNYPPKKRTRKELTKFLVGATERNIGKKQMSTDNAVYVVSEILKGKRIQDLDFIDGIEIKINRIESTILPYRYAVVKGKPFVSEELICYLKRKRGF